MSNYLQFTERSWYLVFLFVFLKIKLFSNLKDTINTIHLICLCQSEKTIFVLKIRTQRLLVDKQLATPPFLVFIWQKQLWHSEKDTYMYRRNN